MESLPLLWKVVGMRLQKLRAVFHFGIHSASCSLPWALIARLCKVYIKIMQWSNTSSLCLNKNHRRSREGFNSHEIAGPVNTRFDIIHSHGRRVTYLGQDSELHLQEMQPGPCGSREEVSR